MLAKPFLLFSLFYVSVFTDAFKQNIRDTYVKSLTNKEEALGLLQMLAKQEQTAFVMGYTGATKMIMAKHAFNPFSKLSYFNSGKRMLQAAIAKDKNSAELVFLRYATQVSAPAILGYTDNVVADRKYILYALQQQPIDEKLAKAMISFMKQQKLTAAEKQLLSNIAK